MARKDIERWHLDCFVSIPISLLEGFLSLGLILMRRGVPSASLQFDSAEAQQDAIVKLGISYGYGLAAIYDGSKWSKPDWYIFHHFRNYYPPSQFR